MKQIFNNRYLKKFKFSSSIEASAFLINQKIQRFLSINDTFGNYHYCYVCYHSLTNKELFVLSFCSDENEDNINILYWNNLLVLGIEKNIYLINENLNINATLEITTPLVGLYLINNEKLLVLEEAFMRVINHKGEIVKSELFDLIEEFSIKDNLLFIQTSEESKVIELN